MKNITFSTAFICLILSACNLPKLNQKHLDKKYARLGIEEKRFDQNGHEIKYFEGGVGDTLLLVHGFGGDGQVTWAKNIKELSAHYHLIIPDLLWFGESKSSKPQNMDSQVDALSSLLTFSQVDRYHIAGISYGGFVTLGMAVHEGEKIDKMVIIDSPGFTYNIDLLDTIAVQNNAKTVEDVFVVKNGEEVERLYNFAFYRDKNFPNGLMQDTYEFYFSENHDEQTELIQSLKAEQERYLSNGIPKQPKSLIIWGEHDMVFPMSEAVKLEKYLNCEMKVIEKAGHAPNIEQLKEFNSIMIEFLKD
jgi:pimeloyl-ACP methyl ester carboxylesterase